MACLCLKADLGEGLIALQSRFKQHQHADVVQGRQMSTACLMLLVKLTKIRLQELQAAGLVYHAAEAAKRIPSKVVDLGQADIPDVEKL